MRTVEIVQEGGGYKAGQVVDIQDDTLAERWIELGTAKPAGKPGKIAGRSVDGPPKDRAPKGPVVRK